MVRSLGMHGRFPWKLLRRAGAVIVPIVFYVYIFVGFTVTGEKALINHYKKQGHKFNGTQAYNAMKMEGISITMERFNDVFFPIVGEDRELNETEIGLLVYGLADAMFQGTHIQEILQERNHPRSRRYFALCIFSIVLLLLIEFLWEEYRRASELRLHERFGKLTRHNEIIFHQLNATDDESQKSALREDFQSNEEEMRKIIEKHPELGQLGNGHGWHQHWGDVITFGHLGGDRYEVNLSADKLGEGADGCYKCRLTTPQSFTTSFSEDAAGPKEYALKILFCGNDITRHKEGKENVRRPFTKLRKFFQNTGAALKRSNDSNECDQVVRHNDVIVVKECSGYRTYVLMDLIKGADGMDVISGEMKLNGMQILHKPDKQDLWNRMVSDVGGNAQARTAVTKADACKMIEITKIKVGKNATLHVGFTTSQDINSSFVGGTGISFTKKGATFHQTNNGKSVTHKIEYSHGDRFELLVDNELDKEGLRHRVIFLNYYPSSGENSTCRLGRFRHHTYFASIILESSDASFESSDQSVDLHFKTTAWIRPTTLLCLAHDLMAGLEHIHSTGSVHCDIKPENVMIEGSLGDPDTRKRPTLKIIDFGNAGMPGHCDYKPYTALYSPPEAYKPEKPKLGAWYDMYSAGATLYAFAFCRLPPKTGFESDMRRWLHNVASEADDPDKLTKSFLEFILALIKEEPESRMAAAGALAHPCLAQESVLAQLQLTRSSSGSSSKSSSTQ